ncbi:MAG: saccharopine dehydrogenase family protein [Bacteroidales bacterium OttesenSCG-928-I14]|jgi:saccharopine dehydrogenase (NAD+, L-lysine-forming)|nr:saccharopine dehydrogenase family protein [Bacteroidales bacterium OttesenSCG-928-I14]
MSRILIIGAGGVGAVVTKNIAKYNNIFSNIMIASRSIAKCNAISNSIKNLYKDIKIETAQVNADNTSELIELFRRFCPNLVINAALPYQDLAIMDACIACKVDYIDTANYEPKDEAKFEYKWQWDYKDKFESAGLTAILGCGFDPGVTNVFTAYAAKHHFDKIYYLDIVDCNAGNHGKTFATNFNSEINIREITNEGKYWENGNWITTKPFEIHKILNYPNIGKKESYIINHEELESLVKHFPTLKRARFWMTFEQDYITHLRIIKNIGMSRIDPVLYNGIEIIPIQFLKAILPDPSQLGENYSGEISIGCRIRGLNKEGKEQTYYIYSNCKHQDAYKKMGVQAISYSTGIPASVVSILLTKNIWRKSGVFNVEEFDPDPFMKELPKHGLTWNELFNIDIEV